MHTSDRGRNYGIDFARLLSMLMVVVLHNLLNGGILSLSSTNSHNLIYWYIENLVIVAVNMFAMVTGYLMVDHKFRLNKILKLWSVVWFWSITTTFVVMVLFFHVIEVKPLIKSVFPVIFKQYWYFNAYLVLFLAIPFINAGFRMMDKDLMCKVVSWLLILFTTVGFINNLFLEKGYSALWLMMMYLVGGVIKKSKNRILGQSTLFLLSIYFIGAAISLLGEYVSMVKLGHVEYWISYNSPIVAIQSIALFVLLSRLKFKNIFIQKFLSGFLHLHLLFT